MSKVKLTIEFTVDMDLSPDVWPHDLTTEEERAGKVAEELNETWDVLESVLEGCDEWNAISAVVVVPQGDDES